MAAPIKRAMQNVEYVFHVAADYRLWARHPNEIFATNVGGTRTIMREALHAAVKRVVYTSSVATLALTADGGPTDETYSMPEEKGIGAYKRSKIAAERLVTDMITHEGIAGRNREPLGPRRAA